MLSQYNNENTAEPVLNDSILKWQNIKIIILKASVDRAA